MTKSRNSNQLSQLVECPYCFKQMTPRGLTGHLRLTHGNFVLPVVLKRWWDRLNDVVNSWAKIGLLLLLLLLFFPGILTFLSTARGITETSFYFLKEVSNKTQNAANATSYIDSFKKLIDTVENGNPSENGHYAANMVVNATYRFGCGFAESWGYNCTQETSDK